METHSNETLLLILFLLDDFIFPFGAKSRNPFVTWYSNTGADCACRRGVKRKNLFKFVWGIGKRAANGFQLIELDLLETTDGRLIAAHDWKTFHQLTGKPEQTKPLSFNQARKRKILGTQHVLTDTDIFHFFNNRPDLYLVTDKIDNLSLLKEKFGAFQDRIIVEVFTLPKYQEAISLGFKNVAFCVWDNDRFMIWRTFTKYRSSPCQLKPFPTTWIGWKRTPTSPFYLFPQMMPQPFKNTRPLFLFGIRMI